MDPVWVHPFSAIITGPSFAGKTWFVVSFIKNMDRMCNTVFTDVYWYYGACRPANIETPVCFKQGLPTSDDLEDIGTPKLVVIDDLMNQTDERVVDLFTKGCHHRNTSVFYITQNIFHQGRGQRDISLNAHYIVFFKNPRDKAQIRHLARQICPENPRFLQEAYADATSEAHGYLLIDLKQNTSEEYRFRTKIFPFDPVNYVYVSRK